AQHGLACLRPRGGERGRENGHGHEQPHHRDGPGGGDPAGHRSRGRKADPQAEHHRQCDLRRTRDIHEGDQGGGDDHHRRHRDEPADKIEHVDPSRSARPRRRPTTRLLPLSKSIGKRCSRSSFGGRLALAEDEPMPYSPEHKRDTREKILESARQLFNRNGYTGVSIEEIMSRAGLTHGGFYRHFSGKDELYAAAVRQFLCRKTPAPWQKRREPAAVTKTRAQRIVDAYFSREHFDDRDGC